MMHHASWDADAAQRAYAYEVTVTVVKPSLPLFVLVAIAFIVVQDALNTIFGVQGFVTIMLAAIALTTIFLRPKPRVGYESPNPKPDLPPLWAWLFVLWAAFGLILNYRVAGIQHVTVWFLLPATAYVTARYSTQGTFRKIYPWWERALITASVIYLALVAINGPGAQAFPYTDRGAGWVLLSGVVLVVCNAMFQGGRLWPIALASAAIILSQSRTPTAILIFLLGVLFVNGVGKGSLRHNPKIVRFLLTTAVGAAAVWFMVTRVSFISERFTIGDGYTIFGIPLNTSGRSVLWEMTVELWQNRWWTGNGPGASQDYISSVFDGGIAHPHNEYLRLLADTGVIGLVLWSAGVIAFLIGSIRRFRSTRDPQGQTLHGASIASILVILSASLTDNVTITVFQMIMFGTYIGLSMSYPLNRHRTALQYHLTLSPTGEGSAS